MVVLKVRLGAKGQIVIPKLLRDAYKLHPHNEALLKASEEGIEITALTDDPLEVLVMVSQAAAKKNSPLHHEPHAIYEQYEKRAKRARL